jgi:hypothetical protein
MNKAVLICMSPRTVNLKGIEEKKAAEEQLGTEGPRGGEVRRATWENDKEGGHPSKKDARDQQAKKVGTRSQGNY